MFADIQEATVWEILTVILFIVAFGGDPRSVLHTVTQ